MKQIDLDRIAETAAELSETDRYGFVLRACKGDEKAMAAVWEHVNFLPPDDFIGDQALCGRSVDDYEIGRKLGEGGSGVVYAARRKGSLDSKEVLDHWPFAVKVLRETHRRSSIVLARFVAEQEALQSMRHPGIAAFVDAGEFEGRPYFVMERIGDSESITDYCVTNKLDLNDRLRLFESTCDAVAHAHQQGIIHRDIKPNNILVEVDAVTGVPRPRLIDFGIAKALEPEDSLTVTQVGEFIGTKAYASPEQLRGHGADTRTDIYGLGAVLYELLTDTPAIDVDSKPDTEQLHRLVCEEPIPWPSTVNRANGKRVVAPMLDWVVQKALEKRAERRYRTVDDFARDVRNFRRGKKVQAHPKSLWYDFTSFIREHRLLTTLFCMLCLTLGFATFVGRRALRAERAKDQLLKAVQRESDQKTEALARAKSAEQEVVANLSKTQKINAALLTIIAPRTDTFGDLEMTHRERLRRTSEAIVSNLEGEPLVEANVRSALGTTFQQYGDHEFAESEFQRCVEICRRELGETHPTTLNNKLGLAVAFNSLGKLEQAATLAESIVGATQAQGYELRSTLLSSALLALAESKSQQGKTEEALAILQQFDVPDTKDWTTLDVGIRHRIINQLTQLGRHDEAIQFSEELLAYERSTVGVAHPSTLSTQKNLAALQVAKNSDRAIELLGETLELARKNDPDHVLVSQVTQVFAGALGWVGRDEESERMYLESIVAQQRVSSNGSSGDPGTLQAYARKVRDRRAFAEAEDIARYSFTVLHAKYGDTHAATAASIETLGSIFEDQADYGKELFWKSRLLLSYYNRNGSNDEATKAIALKVAETFCMWSLHLYHVRSEVAFAKLFLDCYSTTRPATQRPVVIPDGDKFHLQWLPFQLDSKQRPSIGVK